MPAKWALSKIVNEHNNAWKENSNNLNISDDKSMHEMRKHVSNKTIQMYSKKSGYYVNRSPSMYQFQNRNKETKQKDRREEIFISA